MAPILSLLRSARGEGSDAPGALLLRRAHASRTSSTSTSIEELGAALPDFEFVPVRRSELRARGRRARSSGVGRDERPRDLHVRPAADDRRDDRAGDRAARHRRGTASSTTSSRPRPTPSRRRMRRQTDGSTGPPVKKVGDGAGRRGDDPERSFQWYTPKKRRATIYEDVTVDTQPSVHRHLDRGWPVHFEDGRGLWSDDSTALRSGDWYDFRDPGQMWERPYYQAGTAHEQLIEGAVRTAAPRARRSTTSRPSGSSSCARTSRCRRSSSTGSGSRSRAPRATRCRTRSRTASRSRRR